LLPKPIFKQPIMGFETEFFRDGAYRFCSNMVARSTYRIREIIRGEAMMRSDFSIGDVCRGIPQPINGRRKNGGFPALL
jgi:hypothetical protein